MEERIKNGEFLDGLTSWNTGSACGEFNWQVSIHNLPPPYCAISSFGNDCITYLSQSVYLTGVDELTFDARGWLWPSMCGPGWLRVYIGDAVVWESLINIAAFAPQLADVSLFTGIHTLKFCVYSPICGARLDVMAISALGPSPAIILNPISSRWNCAGAPP